MGSDRGFGLVFAFVFAIIGLWPLLGGGQVRLWSLGIAVAFVAVALVFPRILKPLNKIWFKFGLLLGKIVSPIVMTAVFFVAVTPVGWLVRLFGKDLLNLRIKRDAPSYWVHRSDSESPMSSMKKQF